MCTLGIPMLWSDVLTQYYWAHGKDSMNSTESLLANFCNSQKFKVAACLCEQPISDDQDRVSIGALGE